jgi:hypothetical protein
LKVTITIFLLLAFLLFYDDARADGMPMDSTGKVYGNYVSITLNESQINFLQDHRYLKLTPEQHQRLKFLNLPKYIDVLDPYHRGCGCGEIYGMWYAPDKLAFSVDDTTVISTIDSNDVIYHYYEYQFDTARADEAFYISSGGAVYYKDHAVDSAAIKKIFRQFVKEGKFLEIRLPPVSKNADGFKVINTRRWLGNIVPEKLNYHWD